MKEDLIRLLDSETMWANEMIGKASAMLKNAPPGELRVIRHHTNYQYYHSLPGQRNYISKKKPELAISLAQKEYDTAVLTKALIFQEQVDALYHTLVTVQTALKKVTKFSRAQLVSNLIFCG